MPQPKHGRGNQSARLPDRRTMLKGLAGGAVGVGLGSQLRAESTPVAAVSRPPAADACDPSRAPRPIWKLDRPKPALPSSYFWTWDHSTNWMLDDPGTLNFGCGNRYLKQPGTYLEDYRRLTDLAAGLGVKGILIWGFLRNAHGGIDSAKRVADYAASQGVAIMPGIGTNAYGGIYYEGDHPYNLATFVKKHPDARVVDEHGNPQDGGVCPLHPQFVQWLQEGVRWLFQEFAIGGANLENGDFAVCHCPRCKERRATWPKDEPLFWQFQHMGYEPALRAIQGRLKDKLVTWATYKGFLPGSDGSQTHKGPYMQCTRPAFIDKLPPEGVCQWTLSNMVRSDPLPLTKYLDDGAPPEAVSTAIWPADLKPPTARSVGFLHQGSQWGRPPRYEQIVSIVKEGCLRAYRAGLEGVSIHGEVSSMHVPWALNYLAFSHFIHWPEDSLRQWGRKTLGQVLGSPQDGEAFAELFAHWQARSLSEAQAEDVRKRSDALIGQVAAGQHLPRWRFWNWLRQMVDGRHDRQTVSIF